jgi:hypothetical protein
MGYMALTSFDSWRQVFALEWDSGSLWARESSRASESPENGIGRHEKAQVKDWGKLSNPKD